MFSQTARIDDMPLGLEWLWGLKPPDSWKRGRGSGLEPDTVLAAWSSAAPECNSNLEDNRSTFVFNRLHPKFLPPFPRTRPRTPPFLPSGTKSKQFVSKDFSHESVTPSENGPEFTRNNAAARFTPLNEKQFNEPSSAPSDDQVSEILLSTEPWLHPSCGSANERTVVLNKLLEVCCCQSFLI
jgi:hypothetical protein